MCVTDCHDVTLAVKVVLNPPNTIKLHQASHHTIMVCYMVCPTTGSVEMYNSFDMGKIKKR